MKGDRFEKMVEKLTYRGVIIAEAEAIALLRKEHAAVRRMVKKIRPDGDDGSGFMCGYNEAKNDILAALDRRVM